MHITGARYPSPSLNQIEVVEKIFYCSIEEKYMNICVHSCRGPRERVLAEHLLLVRYKASAVSLIYYSIPGGPMCGRPTITYSIDYSITAPSVAILDCWNPLFRYSKNTTSGVDCFFTDVSNQL